MWRFVQLVLHDYYPPRVFVFSPLFRFFRRRVGFSMAVSNLFVWFVSALLHSIPFWLTGNYQVGLFFLVLFLTLGGISTIVVLTTKRTSKTVLKKLRQSR